MRIRTQHNLPKDNQDRRKDQEEVKHQQREDVIQYLASQPNTITRLCINDNKHPMNRMCFSYISFARFNELRMIDVANCRLTHLPADLAQCRHLEILSCFDNYLSSLPDGIGDLPRLRTLMCGNNRLTCLPAFSPHSKIREISAYKNRLTDFPVSCGNSFPWLRNLNLNSNRIVHMPCIFTPHMDTFSISCNPLQTIGNIINMEGGRFYFTNTTLYRLLSRVSMQYVFHRLLTSLLQKDLVVQNIIDPLPCDLAIDRLSRIPEASFYNIMFEDRLYVLHIVVHFVKYVIHRFRFVFYLGKCRRRLREWLFQKVLAPLTERVYHPHKLQRLMDRVPEGMLIEMAWA